MSKTRNVNTVIVILAHVPVLLHECTQGAVISVRWTWHWRPTYNSYIAGSLQYLHNFKNFISIIILLKTIMFISFYSNVELVLPKIENGFSCFDIKYMNIVIKWYQIYEIENLF